MLMPPAEDFQLTQPRADSPGLYTLLPGDVALATQGERLETLLGSCIAVVLTDPHRTVGAMCHIVHVGTPPAGNRTNTAYGSNAMRHMFNSLRNLGIAPELCEAHVFGGGNMFPGLFKTRHVGASNERWVLDFLDEHGIKVRSHSLGGTYYRKIGWTVGPADPEIVLVNVV